MSYYGEKGLEFNFDGNVILLVSSERMQKFRTLAAFFLVEKQRPEKERRRKKIPSTIVTTSAQRRSDQN